MSTARAKRKGAEQMFLELLHQYEIPKKLFPWIELQLKKLFHHFNANSINDQKQLQSQHASLQNQIKQIRIRVGLGQIDKESFIVTIDHLNNQIVEISKELNSGNATTSNLKISLRQH